MLEHRTYKAGDRCPHCDRALLTLAMRVPQWRKPGKSEVQLWCNWCNQITFSTEDNRFFS